jgi:integrase
MPRLSKSLPSYRKHARSGQAVVTIGGRDHYLGPFGTRASKVEYDRLIAEYLASGRQLPRRAEQVMVCAVMAAFLRHAKTYYRSPDGTLSGEIGNFIDAFKPLRKLYGDTSVADFGPLALKAVRQEMVAMKWCRLTVNRHVGRIKHVFRWAVENELVEAAVYDRLRAVIGLRAGRCDAHDPEPVQPVPEDVVEATLPYLSPTVAAMVRLQLLTAARPGEICQMRGVGFDMSRNPWQYRPATHKTAWHGHERVIHFGPRAQEVRPWLARKVKNSKAPRRCHRGSSRGRGCSRDGSPMSSGSGRAGGMTGVSPRPTSGIAVGGGGRQLGVDHVVLVDVPHVAVRLLTDYLQ